MAILKTVTFILDILNKLYHIYIEDSSMYFSDSPTMCSM